MTRFHELLSYFTRNFTLNSVIIIFFAVIIINIESCFGGLHLGSKTFQELTQTNYLVRIVFALQISLGYAWYVEALISKKFKVKLMSTSVKMIKFQTFSCLNSPENKTRSKSVMMRISIRCPRKFHTLLAVLLFIISVIFPAVSLRNDLGYGKDSLAKNEIIFYLHPPANSNRLMNDRNGILSQFHIMSVFINVSAEF